MLNNFKKAISNKYIDNILLKGFVDIEDGVAEFCPDLRYIYFELNSNFIEFESINQYSKLRLRVVDSVNHNYEIDEDMIRAVSSISEIILALYDGVDNIIDVIKFFNLEERKEELICDAIEMQLKNGQMIFLDPTFYFGINIGGIDEKQVWIDNIQENEKVNVKIVHVSS